MSEPAKRRDAPASVPGMDFDLTDEQRLIRDTAREFTDNEIVPRARDNDRNAHFDTELVAKMAAQGYLGAIVPREYGGAGLDYISYGLVVEQIGRGCSSMRTVVSVQTSLVCSAILKWGTEEQKQTYLPKLTSGEWLGCFGLTEPDTGSDAANQKTRAKKTDGGWVGRVRPPPRQVSCLSVATEHLGRTVDVKPALGERTCRRARRPRHRSSSVAAWTSTYRTSRS